MPLSDYYKIKYAILKTLFETMEAGEKLDADLIKPQRFGINESYWIDIMSGMLEEKLIAGISITQCKDCRVVAGAKDTRITPRGIDYLHENSFMKKAYKAFKDVKDIFPIIL